MVIRVRSLLLFVSSCACPGRSDLLWPECFLKSCGCQERVLCGCVFCESLGICCACQVLPAFLGVMLVLGLCFCRFGFSADMCLLA